MTGRVIGKRLMDGLAVVTLKVSIGLRATFVLNEF